MWLGETKCKNEENWKHLFHFLPSLVKKKKRIFEKGDNMNKLNSSGNIFPLHCWK